MKIKRFFKPGDRVRLISGGPIMIVQKYALVRKPFIGLCESDHIVECSYYTGEGYAKDVFHQNSLIKSSLSDINDVGSADQYWRYSG